MSHHTNPAGAKKPTFTSGCTTAAVAAAAAATKVPTDGIIYATTDVYSSPPTLVCIVGSDADAARALAMHPDAYIIDAADMHMHKGWIDALHQFAADPERVANHTGDSLNICFQHAFGRCRGRRDGDPATCQQLHIKPEALARVRAVYRNPVRPFFVRTFTGVLPPVLYSTLDAVTRHAAAGAPSAAVPQSLDFAARDVEMSEGARRVDEEYRGILMNPLMQSAPLRVRPLLLCMPFAVGLPCPFGANCEMLHAPLTAVASRLSAPMTQAITACAAILRDGIVAAVAKVEGVSAASPPPYNVNAAAFEPAVPLAEGDQPPPAGVDFVITPDNAIAVTPPAPAPSRVTPAASLVLMPASADETHLLSDLAGFLNDNAPDASAVGTVG
mmetsp:Transcript_32349/g.100080  ORF Transcript_32349/g.100080 Transcript_32349/m.100080 type:complete len:386 (-) Transcript_32349:92-1249(-)|eukprot:CAMPEP_0174855910 /NCGR_PEP_ID=MMETSP1114-20130205/34579_1 /TAXON_ID=312471 /ORGANISM="Neobodo designis, Strain CCAP 1951/1" /LENGTH=385 /DNA_ID=CAMNT_0016090683 /DNA_START=67 /DNA_END=1224 /DNA_ORIENTATION=-